MISRPPAFLYKNNQLHAERIPLAKLAKRFGTPLYVYSATAVRERYKTFDSAFSAVPHTVCYAVKANSNLHLLRLLAKLGAGFDIVSGGELERVLVASKAAAARTVFSGVGKTADEISFALKSGILLFNVESEAELEVVSALAERRKKRAQISLRVNPDVFAETHPYISTGMSEHKFGVAIDDAPRLYAAAAKHKWISAVGVSVHIGSQIHSAEPFHAALLRVAQLTRTLQIAGHDIRYVDAGGGLGIAYTEETQFDFAAKAAEYAWAVQSALAGLKIHLLLEPGRTLVGPAGALVARVIYTKTNGKKNFVIVDAAMNDLIRPALYKAHHEIVSVRAGKGEMQTADIVGPVCESGDFFARDRVTEKLNAGDLVALLDAGAYGMSLASNYNTRPRAAEILVEGAKARLVRKRETVPNLLRAER